MKIKTAKLTGAALNNAVLQCELAAGKYTQDDTNFSRPLIKFDTVFLPQETGVTKLGIEQGRATHRWSCGCGKFEPSTQWSFGGPIIDRERLFVEPFGAHWISKPFSDGQVSHGMTALMAAMRCYVAMKLGDEVEVPDELVEDVA